MCDGLAHNDWHGLGAGVYPLDSVPLSPHPRDRCERVPVIRSPKEWAEPKPLGLERKLKTKDADVSGVPGMAKLTDLEAARIRKQLSAQFAALEQHGSAETMAKLAAQGHAAGVELANEVAASKMVATAIEAVLMEPPLVASADGDRDAAFWCTVERFARESTCGESRSPSGVTRRERLPVSQN